MAQKFKKLKYAKNELVNYQRNMNINFSRFQEPIKLQELDFAIEKLQKWELALFSRFGDQFKNNPQLLAAHPIWQEVMKVRTKLHRLMAMAEAYR